jgi:hypothetical protein
MDSDPKDRAEQTGEESRVVELFKLLDAWDRDQERKICDKTKNALAGHHTDSL